MGQPVVLVDAYTSGRRLAELFIAAGYECVHVQSQPMIPAVLAPSFQPGDFVRNFVHSGDVEETVRALASLDPVALLPGAEPGVELADELSERLGLRSNGSALSATRRDKYRMVEQVRSAGLAAPEQMLTSDPAELAAWVGERRGRVVVKPLRSAGNDGVRFCDTPEAAVEAMRSILRSQSVFHVDNTAVLAQEYLHGCEYYLNTVSLDGRHHVTDLWRTVHLSYNGVLDLLEGSLLMPPRGEVQDLLVAYAGTVLDALGIRNGPAHSEIKLTPDGPRLIEVGARVCGGDMPHFARQAVGEAQLEWTVDAYVRPERFAQRCDEPYTVHRFAGIKGMISPYTGRLRAYRGLGEIERLESFGELRTAVRPGEHIVPTVDDFTFPVVVTLFHEVEEVVARDFATLQYLDGHAFFEVESEAAAGSVA